MSRPQRPENQSKRQPDAAQATDDQLSLTELTDAADVTVRTVRYYIAEGLLPPPVTAGPQSHYTRGHLDRLRLIARLKEAYLPLREIRRQLAGLDDAAVRHLLDQEERTEAPVRSSARDYLDQVLGTPPRSARRPQPPTLRAQRLPLTEDAAPELAESAVDYSPAVPREPFERPAPLPVGVATPLTPAPLAPLAEDAPPEAWRRVRLADDAELLIRETAYEQRRDRIDWLIRWARRVFR